MAPNLTHAYLELKELKRENGMLKKLAENLDNELKRYRAKPFADDVKESFQGVRSFDKELIEQLGHMRQCLEQHCSFFRVVVTQPLDVALQLPGLKKQCKSLLERP